jgi:hypothetical protein
MTAFPDNHDNPDYARVRARNQDCHKIGGTAGFL